FKNSTFKNSTLTPAGEPTTKSLPFEKQIEQWIDASSSVEQAELDASQLDSNQKTDFDDLLLSQQTESQVSSTSSNAQADSENRRFQVRLQSSPRRDSFSSVAEKREASDSGDEDSGGQSFRGSMRAAFLSTLMSLLVVLVLLLAVRLVVPTLVEEIRYAWFRGQLRAQYDTSGQALQQVSMGGLNDVSKLISQKVGPSVVHINVRDVANNRWRDLLEGEQAPEALMLQGQGSGVLVDDQGHILTNYHVIESGTEIEVSLSDGRRVLAKVVGVDHITDIALLKVDVDHLMPITWGDSDAAEVGSLVWAAGSPYGLKSSFTLGILSGKHRTDLRGNRFEPAAGERDRGVYRDLMQSDVAVNPGNSGGPLMNSRGELIGINTAIVGDSYRGISFAIPSNVAKSVYERLLESGSVERGWLGVRLADYVEDQEGETRTGLGALVSDIPASDDSPARKGGVEVGDVIVEFNGQKVPDHFTLKRFIGEAGPNAEVKMVVVRKGKRLELKLTLGARPDEGVNK
ncbi:MAG: putative periplasmic serine endoprotease DegP-like precursor, partial [Planctomycetota bacterium]